MPLVSRKLYEIIGAVCGFVLIDYGFNFIAVGLPGARSMTSQFVGATLLLGGSAGVFISIYHLLQAVEPTAPQQALPGGAPDVEIEMVVEEQTPPQYRFYKNIEYIGYFFTALGLFSAADLILQVFISQLYNETRWWVEILLVVIGVLAYAIFVSIGRIGAEEERALSTTQPSMAPTVATERARKPATVLPESLEVDLNQFSKSTSGEYEHKLSDDVYDVVRVQPDVITIWREDRRGIRPIYLAGPYELTGELLEGHVKRSEQLRIGILSITTETTKALLNMQKQVSENST